MLARLYAFACISLALIAPAGAQAARVVQDCTGRVLSGDTSAPLTVDQNGNLCMKGVLGPSASATGGLSTYRVNSPAGTVAMMVKAAPGRLYSFNLCNTASATRYVRFYNATTPVVGTTPVFAGAIAVSAGSCQQFTTNFGLTFSAGIGLGITAANGDADTTAVTAGDVSGFIGYQ